MLAQFKTWLDSPFSGNMSALRWFAFVGLLLAISGVWSLILKHFEAA
jgi:hypothetical protein